MVGHVLLSGWPVGFLATTSSCSFYFILYFIFTFTLSSRFTFYPTFIFNLTFDIYFNLRQGSLVAQAVLKLTM